MVSGVDPRVRFYHPLSGAEARRPGGGNPRVKWAEYGHGTCSHGTHLQRAAHLRDGPRRAARDKALGAGGGGGVARHGALERVEGDELDRGLWRDLEHLLRVRARVGVGLGLGLGLGLG